ncbi:MAG: non-heme iron oxygenase ferredoxin subunit [Pirellulales bacterium]|nr:non-heme iron oxygenase ferredoxin subunit [Pirellulales bacterium]
MAMRSRIAHVTELEPGEAKMIAVGDKTLALFNVDGTFYATDNACSHVGGPLSEGSLIGKEVTCPWHGAQFDVTSGKALGGPARGDAKCYPVSVDGDDILVELE